LKRASRLEMKVRHGSSAAVPEILDATIADGEEDRDTRPLHTGPSDRVGEPHQCSTNHLDEGMYSSRTRQRTPQERDFHQKKTTSNSEIERIYL
jgi:hypothetical protein